MGDMRLGGNWRQEEAEAWGPRLESEPEGLGGRNKERAQGRGIKGQSEITKTLGAFPERGSSHRSLARRRRGPLRRGAGAGH
jgi:hypothetical protein